MANTNAAGVEYIGNGNSSGTSLGKSATELVSAYGVTPVVQADNITAVATTAATSTSPWGFAGSTQANAIVTAINSINTAIQNFGITASS